MFILLARDRVFLISVRIHSQALRWGHESHSYHLKLTLMWYWIEPGHRAPSIKYEVVAVPTWFVISELCLIKSTWNFILLGDYIILHETTGGFTGLLPDHTIQGHRQRLPQWRDAPLAMQEVAGPGPLSLLDYLFFSPCEMRTPLSHIKFVLSHLPAVNFGLRAVNLSLITKFQKKKTKGKRNW